MPLLYPIKILIKKKNCDLTYFIRRMMLYMLQLEISLQTSLNHSYEKDSCIPCQIFK